MSATPPELAREANACSYCPNLCVHVCPVAGATGSHTLAPMAKVSMVRWTAEQRVPDDQSLGAAFYGCTDCGACTEACRHERPVGDILAAARAAWAGTEAAPYEAATFEPPPSRRAALGQAGETAWLTGCGLPRPAAWLRERGHECNRRTCCGQWLAAGGHVDRARAMRRELLESLRGVRRLVVGSAACARWISEGLEGARGEGEPVPLEVVVWVAAGGVPVPSISPDGVALLAGCQLERRVPGGLAAARALAERVCGGAVPLLEGPGDVSPCCGAGAPWAQVDPSGARRAARRVLELARVSGVRTLLVADPVCAAHLRDGSRTGEVDVVDLIAIAYGRRQSHSSSTE